MMEGDVEKYENITPLLSYVYQLQVSLNVIPSKIKLYFKYQSYMYIRASKQIIISILLVFFHQFVVETIPSISAAIYFCSLCIPKSFICCFEYKSQSL